MLLLHTHTHTRLSLDFFLFALVCCFIQVAEPVPAGRKMVRQLMHVNGVEADELTLAEVGQG